MSYKKFIHLFKKLVFRINQIRINRILSLRGENNPFFFIQIGSGDGITGDPIYPFVTKYKWNGIVVEPVGHLFARLVDAYKFCKGVHCEHGAIHKEKGARMFYRLREGARYERSGSFDKKHLLNHRHKIKNFEEKLVEETVKCFPFSHLLKKYNIKKIDLLHIDAEGYDYEIIKMIPFHTIKPRMIYYENRFLSPLDKQQCKRLLKEQGYRIIKAKDTFAYF